MNDDLMEINGLDQSLPIDTAPILKKIDEVMQESIERSDVYYALDFGVNLIQMAQLSGMGLAKLVYLIKENWGIFEIGDNFEDVAYSYLGRSKDTIDRHVRVWGMYEKKLIPEEFKDEIKQKNIKDQIPIATMLSQGIVVDHNDWQDLADAPDHTSVAHAIRKIKKEEPRKSALLIFISDDGSLTAQQEGVTQYVGFLNIDDAEDIAEKAIQRIIRSVGVLQR